MSALDRFAEIFFVDFEYGHEPGDHPTPRCVVAHELRSGRVIRVWIDEGTAAEPPFPLGSDVLYVAYLASAELSCHLRLGWPLPCNILDLYGEFRFLTNGTKPTCGNSLLGALTYFDLDAMSGAEKSEMRDLALRGGHYTAEEQLALLDYCQSDVDALARLLPLMEPRLDLERALLRGRYMKAVALMEARGVPLDVPTLRLFLDHRDKLKEALIADVDRDFDVYQAGVFRESRWADWLRRRGLSWPLNDSGRLSLDKATFNQAAAAHPEVAPIAELRALLSKLRRTELAVGADGRNRTMLSPFRSLTGRNQPSNSKFIFGAPGWMRGLIQPKPGDALAYIDWSQQEFGIAASLSGDAAMMAAYREADPYLACAKQAGAAPADATVESHPEVRARFKACVLGVQYGIGSYTLAAQIGQSPAHAQALLDLHRRTYPRYWEWSQAAVDRAMLQGVVQSSFGWQLRAAAHTKASTVMNFPMQANGAEMLRLACILGTERGVAICAPVYDAVLIEADEADIEAAADLMANAMAEASRLVLDGFELRTDMQIVRYPDRLIDAKHRATWDRVLATLEQLERGCTIDGASASTRPLSSGSLMEDGP